jgi:hypothetical protein
MAHHEGQIIERKAGGATQRTDDGALLFAGFPGQRVRQLERSSQSSAPRLRHLRTVSVLIP